ncbi:prokaryotic E2 ligase family D protein [Chitinophaga sp. GbtcB8]|uniref:prokaryotic E2 ligase family D protein n=1 Tax=Chitinophaga sp. GbtcB8 TaxID=2824753 RepID=UPI001C30885D|nr:prokaryotic E2 ligase family D protein [Chitinophaga sp. GbtcB8]
MNTAMDITRNFGTLYHPKSALVFYETGGSNSDMYVEYFDMDKNGNPVNAHPLTIREAQRLSKALRLQEKESQSFLRPKGILPNNVLHINSAENGNVTWYTKQQVRQLYFSEKLGLPNGNACVPPLLWHANRNALMVFALASDRKPSEKTVLYHAPFFNVYDSGNVCMGNVDVQIKASASLEEFMNAWETYFFNSYFSHLMQDHNPIKGNCVSLWGKLLRTGEPFPKDVLVKNNRTVKNILR